MRIKSALPEDLASHCNSWAPCLSGGIPAIEMLVRTTAQDWTEVSKRIRTEISNDSYVELSKYINAGKNHQWQNGFVAAIQKATLASRMITSLVCISNTRPLRGRKDLPKDVQTGISTLTNTFSPPKQLHKSLSRSRYIPLWTSIPWDHLAKLRKEKWNLKPIIYWKKKKHKKPHWTD